MLKRKRDVISKLQIRKLHRRLRIYDQKRNETTTSLIYKFD